MRKGGTHQSCKPERTLLYMPEGRRLPTTVVSVEREHRNIEKLPLMARPSLGMTANPPQSGLYVYLLAVQQRPDLQSLLPDLFFSLYFGLKGANG